MPAIDLRDGACVQLVGGAFDREAFREPDPMAAAERWRAAGFSRLHVVDLDAAVGSGTNAGVLRRLLGIERIAFQVGGGLRSSAAVEQALTAGAAAVVIGTRAIEEPLWCREIANRWPGKVIVAVDLREGRPLLHGWRRFAETDLPTIMTELNSLPLAAVLTTSVDVEGRLAGPDLTLTERVLALSTHPVIASGGIASLDDLRALRRLGVFAAVVGMALYTGALDPRAIAQEFRQ